MKPRRLLYDFCAVRISDGLRTGSVFEVHDGTGGIRSGLDGTNEYRAQLDVARPPDARIRVHSHFCDAVETARGQ